jgi:hypothetical protein
VKSGDDLYSVREKRKIDHPINTHGVPFPWLLQSDAALQKSSQSGKYDFWKPRSRTVGCFSENQI